MANFDIIAFFIAILMVVKAEVITVDLSYDYIENFTYFAWPKSYLKRTANPLNGNHTTFWMYDYDFFMGEHGGTHLDAPHHFCRDCKTVEQIPLSDLLNLPLCVVNVSAKTKGPSHRDYQLTVADLEEWESKHGRIPAGGVVFVNFGWAQYYPARKTFLGSEGIDISNMQWHHPGYGAAAVDWLADKRKVKGIGTDAANFDVGSARTFPSHTAWLKRGNWAIEVLANLDKVPATGTRVSVLPTKFKGGTGAPSRVYAMWSTDGAATWRHHVPLVLTCLITCILSIFQQP